MRPRKLFGAGVLFTPFVAAYEHGLLTLWCLWLVAVVLVALFMDRLD